MSFLIFLQEVCDVKGISWGLALEDKMNEKKSALSAEKSAI